MPLYICNAKDGLLSPTAKQRIAEDITNIHCDVTGAPPVFVHVAFFEDAPYFPLDDFQLYIRGTIRKGRSSEQKDSIASRIRESAMQHGGVNDDETGVLILETPASWVLEGGEIMPEPGEEEAWFAAHEASRAAGRD